MDRPLYAKEIMTPWTMIGNQESGNQRFIQITADYLDTQHEYFLAVDRNGAIIGKVIQVKPNDTLLEVAEKMKMSNAEVAEVVDEVDRRRLGIIMKAEIQALAQRLKTA